MTTDMDERLYAMEEIARSVAADQVDFRQQVAAGTPLGETELEGLGKAKWRKSASLTRMGALELPERVALYNRETGDVSMVPPTIANSRIMRNPQVFTMRKPENWTQPEPIPETCEICTLRRKGIPRPFYSEYDLEAHWQILHPREWALRQRNEDREQKRESDDRLATLIEMLIRQQTGRIEEDEGLNEKPVRRQRSSG